MAIQKIILQTIGNFCFSKYTNNFNIIINDQLVEIYYYLLRWMIHDNPPGKDFYNWTSRCLSAGSPYNPYKVLKLIKIF